MCFLLILQYFFVDVVKLHLDGTAIGGYELDYYCTAFDLYNGNYNLDKEYISNVVSIGLLILPICLIIVSIIFKSKIKRIINAVLFLIMFGIFIYSFVYFYDLYSSGIEVTETLIITSKTSLTVFGYLSIFIMLLGFAFSLFQYIKK